jgi:hypothetical protein
MAQEQNIPVQREGGKTDVSESIKLDSGFAAKQFFKLACQRLKDVNKWHEVCGSEATTFALIDSDGKAAFRDAQEGDYFKINIPGPGNSVGDGFDWVRVEEVSLKSTEEEEVFFIRVRPTDPPVKDDKEVAHFFKDQATSTFMVRRKDSTVSAEVHGRNEKPNVDTSQVKDKVRNAVVGTASLLGFSLPQWKMLVKGLVKLE